MSEDVKKLKKRLYDMEYRRKNSARLKISKAAYYQRTCDRLKEKEIRLAKKQERSEYIKSPRYVTWKKKYDENYRDNKLFGEFFESQRLLIELEKELDKQADKYDRRYLSGRLNKKMNRRRYYEKLKREKLERVPLEHIKSVG